MGKITIDEMHNSLFDYAQAVSDESLMTESKTIVGAINEIYGKNLIADSIGEPLNNTDTFTKMSDDINSLLSTFKTNMMNAGAVVESNDKFKQLIDKIKGLTEGEGNKGIQFAEGIETIIVDYTAPLFGGVDFREPDTWEPVKQISINVGFKPVYILLVSEEFQFCQYEGTTYYSIPQGYFELNNMSYCNINYTEYGGKMVRDKYWYNDGTSDGSEFIFDRRTEINNTGFDLFYRFLNVWSGYAIQNLYANVPLKWIAIGVGEEDTTLRDSLASILEDEGVEVTEEDDMATLISKVDEEFDRQVVPVGDATVEDVIAGKTFMNNMGELLTGALVSGLNKIKQDSLRTDTPTGKTLVVSATNIGFKPSIVIIFCGNASSICIAIQDELFSSFPLNGYMFTPTYSIGAGYLNALGTSSGDDYYILNNRFKLTIPIHDVGPATVSWIAIGR